MSLRGVLKSAPGFYVQLATDSPEPSLHHGILGQSDDERYEVLISADVPVEIGQLVFVFFEQDRIFRKQPTRLARAQRVPDGLCLELETTGDPVCAERRRQRRRLMRR